MFICPTCYNYDKCKDMGYADAEKCANYERRMKPKTQFDRIKTMSVEEMTKILVSYAADMDCYFIYGGKGRRFYDEESAVSAQVQYLESEVAE